VLGFCVSWRSDEVGSSSEQSSVRASYLSSEGAGGVRRVGVGHRSAGRWALGLLKGDSVSAAEHGQARRSSRPSWPVAASGAVRRRSRCWLSPSTWVSTSARPPYQTPDCANGESPSAVRRRVSCERGDRKLANPVARPAGCRAWKGSSATGAPSAQRAAFRVTLEILLAVQSGTPMADHPPQSADHRALPHRL